MYEDFSKEELYVHGRSLAVDFLDKNKLPHPIFHTYDQVREAIRKNGTAVPRTFQFLKCVMDGPVQGTGTGLYYDSHVFVNVQRTAYPVQHLKARSWSWPGWKTDRTAIGVVAHEVGHYVETELVRRGILTQTHGAAWRELISTYKKPVSGYEPVPSEAAAETMRLFILNPDLLQKALPERYTFIRNLGLIPSVRRSWKSVLSNEYYFDAGERWIKKNPRR